MEGKGGAGDQRGTGIGAVAAVEAEALGAVGGVTTEGAAVGTLVPQTVADPLEVARRTHLGEERHQSAAGWVDGREGCEGHLDGDVDEFWWGGWDGMGWMGGWRVVGREQGKMRSEHEWEGGGSCNNGSTLRGGMVRVYAGVCACLSV